MSRPLIVTADADLLDDLLRLAATSGVEADVANEAAAARRCWAAASLVLVGADLAEACGRGRLGRRQGVVVVGDDLDDAGVWQRAVQVGAEHVVFLPDAEPWLISALADAVEGRAQDGLLVAVVGGRGGAGATTLAGALGQAGIRRGLRALLVDADPLSGGIDLLFGAELATGLRWPDLGRSRGRLPAQALAEALPTFEGLAVLSTGREQDAPLQLEAVQSVLSAARRTFELVVVDLPRSFDEVSCEVLSQAGTTLLIVPSEVRATAAAAQVAARAVLLCRDVRLVVRGPAPGGLGAAEVGRALGLPLAGCVRAEPGLESALERGEPPAARDRSPLAGLCAELLDNLVDSSLRRSA